MERLSFDGVIIGGGVVGLASAWQILKSYPEQKILLIERNYRLGMETTSRNSEVIHAGIYYQQGSNKERFCLAGRELLYQFCEEHSVSHRRCEKIIVAQDQSELPELERIQEIAKRNDIAMSALSGDQVRKLEPRVNAVAGLLSPWSGIICSESLVQRLAELCEEREITIALKSTLQSWERTGTGYELKIAEPGQDGFIAQARWVINAAGLSALDVAKMQMQFPGADLKFVRGHYMSLPARYQNICSRLIYPVPDTKGGGLGIHLTLALDGSARLGPDVDWSRADQPDFQFYESEEESLRQKFYTSSKRYLPELQPADLKPGFVGVRPKLVDANGKMLDFYVEEETAKGFPAWVNLIGIESPGLTACLALGNHVRDLLHGVIK